MMRPSVELSAVYLCRSPVDFRKGIQGLAVLVEDALGLAQLRGFGVLKTLSY